MKDPADWNETDLEDLIRTEAEENINLEFKRAEALENMKTPAAAESCKTEISKDVSAFANSAGGMIIYGIAEDNSPTHRATALSPIDPANCSKDRLEQIVNSRIQPRIQGLVIHPIPLSRQYPGKVIYIVQIPQSFTAHQAYDKKYYKRFNFQAVPMEDYEIRQAMNRARRPTYSVDLTTTETGGEINFYGHVQNVSEVVGHEVSIILLVPNGLASSH
jgi:predicted HTH transcriptional regulator